MKRTKRLLALLLALVMVLAAFTLAACNKTKEPSKTPAETEEGGATEAPAQTNPDGSAAKVEYSVSVKTIGGRAISGITFHIYQGDDIKGYSTTDENGIGTVSLVPANDYTVELSTTALDGYKVEERYSFNGNTANIVLTSSVIVEETDLTGVNYELGDVMRDFEVTTTEGKKIKLSEVLKEKKAVLINFWYSTCSPCINEFPYLQSAYETYQEDIEVIALNNYPSDSEATVKAFKAEMGLTFPVAKDNSGLYYAFTDLVTSIYGQTGYPTSIMIDRYGVICLVELGGLTSEKPFNAAFEHFSAENYEQTIFQTIDELTPTELPNIEMPSSEDISAALNGSGFTATYFPETESGNSEYSWPFIIGKKDGVTCVYPSNAKKDGSFATMHATVKLKAGEALAIDWLADTELGVDMLIILVDNKDIYRISGTSDKGWQTCYPYVAVEDGTHKITFLYTKDGDTDVGEDTVYLKNFRTVDASKVDTDTYIPRLAATNPNENGLGFKNYVTVAFNEKDGYYHVGTADGPILLVNLMDSTLLSETSLNLLGYNGQLIDEKGDIYEKLVDYCNYSINGNLYGYSPVTKELRELLERAADIVGFEPDNANEWLKACSYYDAYGTNGKQLEDPVKGVAFFAAFDTLLSTDEEEIFNEVYYDGRVLMPRGFKYKFVPTVSGAYIIKSQSDQEVNGWIFDDKYEIIHTAEITERPYGNKEIDTDNVTMIVYMEAGKTYYIDIAYYDTYGIGGFTFTVKYLGESYDQFHIASPGYFTYTESTTGQLNETIAGGINVKLGEDGYYHELRADGTLGSLVYADFTIPTVSFTSQSIKQLIALGAFNFSISDYDKIILDALKTVGGDKDDCRAYFQAEWGEEYDFWAEEYKLEEVLAGKYHGSGEDLTEEISAYLDKLLPKTDDAPELEGCIAVDEDLAKILQKLMDKYTFEGVVNSWTKLCYYYKHVGA